MVLKTLQLPCGQRDPNGVRAQRMTCVETTSTTSACTGTAIVHQYDLDNSSAGHQVQLRIFG
jgi:hypothetical protein